MYTDPQISIAVGWVQVLAGQISAFYCDGKNIRSQQFVTLAQAWQFVEG